jgi:CRP-like cAMP-binding protein
LVVLVVTLIESVDPAPVTADQPQQSLAPAAARNLATTTKSVPQMQGVSSRWLLRLLPWIEAGGGVYRVNRRLNHAVGDGRITFVQTGSRVQVIPVELGELAALRGFDDEDTLAALAGRFVQREVEPGEVLVEGGSPAGQVVLVAHGKLSKIAVGEYGGQIELGTLADGDHLGEELLITPGASHPFTAKALTHGTVLTLSRGAFEEILEQSEGLRAHLATVRTRLGQSRNAFGEAEIKLASGHDGEPVLPATFVDYDASPREYQLSVAQTMLRVHTRVEDLYNQPMNQFEQQLRLTIEALRERQELEMVNNPGFGLLHNADFAQRINTRTGPPTPDDLDDLLSLVWKDPGFFLAHPRSIAAFFRECTRCGVYPDSAEINGHHVPAWRGVPILPCGKIPVTSARTSSIMLMRTGEQEQGVIALRQTGLPDEHEPGLSVRLMGVNDQAIATYQVSTYYSAAVLVPDALAVLEHVQTGKQD